MIRRDLLTIILRLGIGFFVLTLLGFFLWNRSHKAAAPSGPTPTPTAVTIVTPTPTPTPATLPTIGPDQETSPESPHDGKDGRIEPEPSKTDQNRTYVKRTYVIETYTYITREEAPAFTSGYGASADAKASTGHAWASASASAGF